MNSRQNYGKSPYGNQLRQTTINVRNNIPHQAMDNSFIQQRNFQEFNDAPAYPEQFPRAQPFGVHGGYAGNSGYSGPSGSRQYLAGDSAGFCGFGSNDVGEQMDETVYEMHGASNRTTAPAGYGNRAHQIATPQRRNVDQGNDMYSEGVATPYQHRGGGNLLSTTASSSTNVHNYNSRGGMPPDQVVPKSLGSCGMRVGQANPVNRRPVSTGFGINATEQCGSSRRAGDTESEDVVARKPGLLVSRPPAVKRPNVGTSNAAKQTRSTSATATAYKSTDTATNTTEVASPTLISISLTNLSTRRVDMQQLYEISGIVGSVVLGANNVHKFVMTDAGYRLSCVHYASGSKECRLVEGKSAVCVGRQFDRNEFQCFKVKVVTPEQLNGVRLYQMLCRV